MARVAVVGNATHDLNRTGLIAARRPGGTLLYASLALDALGHDVRPVGHAPLRAYFTLRTRLDDRQGLKLAIRGTRFLNEYENHAREQWAREGPTPALEDPGLLEDVDAVLLGPVLDEVPAGLALPTGVPALLDVQGCLRRLGASNLWGYRKVEQRTSDVELPDATHVRGSIDEIGPFVDTDDAGKAARRVNERTGVPAIVTVGRDGAVGFDGAPHSLRLPPVDVDDPTGSGDVFDAGFLHGLTQGASLEACLGLGCAAAGLFLENADRRLPQRFPSREAVKERAGEAQRGPGYSASG